MTNRETNKNIAWFGVSVWAVLILFCPEGYTNDQIPAPPQDHPIALVGGTIHPVESPSLERGIVLFENGKISAIDANISLPENTEIIDVRGKHVYPGMIAANTQLGLVEIGAVRATVDFAETGEMNPNVRAEVAVNPDSELIPVTRANGITLALAVPTGGFVSGTSALLMLDGWTWEEMTLKSPVGMHINWPSMSIDRSPDAKKKPEEQKRDLQKTIQKLKNLFAEARAYHRAKQAESGSGVPYHDTDPRLEALIPVIERKIPALVNANEIRQIQAAVDWAVDEDVQIVLVGGYDAWRAADLLKENKIPVIVSGIHILPERRWEGYDTPFTIPLKLREAGVQFCIAGGGAMASTNVRNLPYLAATAAAFGLPRDEALRSVTLYPAQILGIADRVGSLAVGKDATIIVTDGDPLDIRSQVEREFIQGRPVDLSSRHTQLYEKYSAKYRQQSER